MGGHRSKFFDTTSHKAVQMGGSEECEHQCVILVFQQGLEVISGFFNHQRIGKKIVSVNILTVLLTGKMFFGKQQMGNIFRQYVI